MEAHLLVYLHSFDRKNRFYISALFFPPVPFLIFIYYLGGKEIVLI